MVVAQVKLNYKVALVIMAASSIACGLGNFALDGISSISSEVIYYDDFSNPESGWERTNEGGIKDYFQGTYHIRVEYTNYFSWSVAHQSVGDVRIGVDLAYTGDAEIAEMGIICRLQNSDNFYFFTIRSDAHFGVFKRQEGSEYFIGMDGYQTSPVINEGITTNRVEAECVGNRLSLFVNDQHLITVNDSSFPIGDAGLIVGAFDQPNVNVYFDNFEILPP